MEDTVEYMEFIKKLCKFMVEYGIQGDKIRH